MGRSGVVSGGSGRHCTNKQRPTKAFRMGPFCRALSSGGAGGGTWWSSSRRWRLVRSRAALSASSSRPRFAARAPCAPRPPAMSHPLEAHSGSLVSGRSFCYKSPRDLPRRQLQLCLTGGGVAGAARWGSGGAGVGRGRGARAAPQPPCRRLHARVPTLDGPG